jgi:hypothetical protein
MNGPGTLRPRIAAAHAEALRVHDSPVRADQLERTLHGIVAGLPAEALPEDREARVLAALESALRVLRREEDGREAARHLQTALAQLEDRVRKPSPFLDD